MRVMISFQSQCLKRFKSFVSGQFRENDMAANVKQMSKKDCYNSESFISDQAKDSNGDSNTIQTMKKRNQREKKYNSKVDVSESSRHRC